MNLTTQSGSTIAKKTSGMMSMYRSNTHGVILMVAAFYLCALSAFSTAPSQNAADLWRKLQNAEDQKQIWIAPERSKELAGDYIARLRKGALAGVPNAQATLGLCYQAGLGVTRDFKSAAEWYAKAAASGHAGAQNNLGLLYDNGAGVPHDAAKAHELYLAFAQKGLADAQSNVGLNYAIGSAVTQDWLEAAKWYRKAAAQGYLPAMNNLGNIYFKGRGVPIDLEEAKKHLRKPAEAGLAVSQFGLAAAFIEQGNITEALPWLRRSAEGGYAGGEHFLAAALLEGKVMDRNVTAALAWARKAAAKGYADSQALVAQILIDQNGNSPNASKEAFQYARKAAEQGNARGQSLLGVCYERGVGVKTDLALAARYFRSAAEMMDPAAALNFGQMRENGAGVDRDFADAAKWYRVAAEAGSDLAQYRLGLCYRDGLGAESDLAEAAKWLRQSLRGANNPEASTALAEVERQLKKQPVIQAEIEFQRGTELGQQAEAGADTYREAAGHFQKAADSGHQYAIAILAGLYRRGTGVAPDEERAETLIAKVEATSDPALLHYIGMSYTKKEEKLAPANAPRALKFFRRAALQGYPPSQNSLGFALMSDPESPDSLIEACQWLTLSSQAGIPEAKVNFERLRPLLTKGELAEGQRRAANFSPVLENPSTATK